jgi:glycosyltransferase involved in cell wall biosynthesis
VTDDRTRVWMMTSMQDESFAAAGRVDSLRLTLISPTPPLRGGIAHYSTALVRTLRARHQVQLVGLVRQYPKLLFPGASEQDSSAVPIDLRADLVIDPLAPSSWRAPARIIAAYAPVLIVIAWWQPALGAILTSFAHLVRRRMRRNGRGTRVALLCHNVSAHKRTPLDRALKSCALRFADSAIAHSDADAHRLFQARADLRVLRTTHPAYDLPEFGPPMDMAAARAKLGLPGEVILFFGLIRRYKGLADLLRAMPRILRERDCTLLVVGEFYERRVRYDALLVELGIGKRVRILDRYVPNEEVNVYFSAADVVVVPYRAATQSGVVALAQQFHRPVVVSRVGSLPDMIEDGVTGLVVPPGDPNALAAAVLRIYEEGVSQWCVRARAARVTTWAEEANAIERLATE